MTKKRIICLFVLTAFMIAIFAIGAGAATDIPTDEELGGAFSPERIGWAVQVTVVGMLTVFSVLALLWGVFSITKIFLYTIPEKRRAKTEARIASRAAYEPDMPAETDAQTVAEENTQAPKQDDGELVAVITAAVASAIESGNYPEFKSGFRVVSFKRNMNNSNWNRK